MFHWLNDLGEEIFIQNFLSAEKVRGNPTESSIPSVIVAAAFSSGRILTTNDIFDWEILINSLILNIRVNVFPWVFNK